ncbi:MAG: hypothetical protein ACR2MX_01555, partial [Cyclobacteriaceae bacterium]
IWTILLIVTVLVLPVIMHFLHKTWKAARSIEIYFADMLKAGVGIAGNTDHITALNDTIEVASGILNTAGEIDAHAETIETTLGQRAAKLN